MLLLCGIASLYMDMAVGQYSRQGPYHMLSQFCPLFKGMHHMSAYYIWILFKNIPNLTYIPNLLTGLSSQLSVEILGIKQSVNSRQNNPK